MSEYGCSICKYTSINKDHVLRHISKKNNCGDNPQLVVIPVEIVCEFCDKQFSTKKILNNHIKHNCKNKIGELEKELELAKQKIKELENKQPSINNVMNGNINITNNIIVLNGYDDTDVSKLNDRHFLKAINKMCLSVPTMIKDVHFNPNMPENQNIYISNMRNGYVMVFNKETKNWDARPKEEMIDKLINDREYDIQEWLGCEKYPKAMQKFNEYIEKKEEDGVQKMIKEEVELVLYNNRNMIKNK